MNNKKAVWLGLVASLAITPVLVAQLTGPPGPAAEPTGPAGSALPSSSMEQANPGLDAGPSAEPRRFGFLDWLKTANRADAPSSVQRAGPFLAPPAPNPNFGLSLTGQEKQPETKQPAPPQPVTAPPEPSTTPARLERGFGKDTTKPPSDPSPSPGTGSVSGPEAAAVNPSNLSDLLAKSNNAIGVEIQRRSPLVGDPRIDGFHFGQIVTQSDGGYWFPARVDLDSVISKLSSDNIDNINIIKGPFSVRYGSGFSFLDIESLPTPRSTSGELDVHGSTALTYRTNGQAGQGEQNIWGGNSDWGFRLSYSMQAAGDYESGNGAKLPSSYNNQFVNLALGFDLSPTSKLEVRYMHAQQSNVLIPGLLTDINELVSDAFTARYTSVQGPWYDRLTIDAWVNNTKFNGDSSNPQTRAYIPQLDNIFPTSLSPANAAINTAFGPVRLDITTSGNALSYGAREITTWGDVKGFNISSGADIKVFSSFYNEFDSFNYSVLKGTATPANLGIPNGRQIEPGVFADTSVPFGENLVVKVGVRADFNTTQFLGFGPNVDTATYDPIVGNPDGDKTFFLFSGFAAAEYKIDDHWTAQAGYGYAERAPTLTELYAGGAFLGLIQNGFNSIYGNTALQKEEIHQINVGLTGKYDDLRVGGNAYYAFMPDYITYDNLGPFTVSNIPVPGGPSVTGTTPINQFRFVNTKLATMYGFDAYGEYDATPWLTPFATLSFVEGWDQTRDEALPGIPPLSSRVGLRFHDPGKNPRWGVEYYARMVATQDLFAASLLEERTGGFVVHNIRSYWQIRDNVLLLAGVENIGNLQYREHLDLRTGLGVFQPGINFYFGLKVNY